MVEAGAAILDIGAESTRPGATPVSDEEETNRLLPVLERIAPRLRIPISVDTTKASVARRALDAGATIINDVSALRFDPAMAPLIADRKAGVVLMHMQGTPQTMQREPYYHDVVEEVRTFLADRVSYCIRLRISLEQIVLDPGFGFGKLEEHNVALLKNLSMLTNLGRPLMAGVSRKSFIGRLTGRPIHDRLWGTAAAVALAAERGAAFLRVHDVEAMRDVLALTTAVMHSPLMDPNS
jgi:dihydropteroate synthase